MRLFALIAAAFALALPQTASAWGFYAHTITADIAEANVKPETRRAIERLMRVEDQIGTPDCPLASIQDASVWPDCLRGEGWRWAYTFPWHYQTEPITEEYSDRKNCSGGSCVSAQVTRNQRVLADESLPENVRLEALAFLGWVSEQFEREEQRRKPLLIVAPTGLLENWKNEHAENEGPGHEQRS